MSCCSHKHPVRFRIGCFFDCEQPAGWFYNHSLSKLKVLVSRLPIMTKWSPSTILINSNTATTRWMEKRSISFPILRWVFGSIARNSKPNTADYFVYKKRSSGNGRTFSFICVPLKPKRGRSARLDLFSGFILRRTISSRVRNHRRHSPWTWGIR